MFPFAPVQAAALARAQRKSSGPQQQNVIKHAPRKRGLLRFFETLVASRMRKAELETEIHRRMHIDPKK